MESQAETALGKTGADPVEPNARSRIEADPGAAPLANITPSGYFLHEKQE